MAKSGKSQSVTTICMIVGCTRAATHTVGWDDGDYSHECADHAWDSYTDERATSLSTGILVFDAPEPTAAQLDWMIANELHTAETVEVEVVVDSTTASAPVVTASQKPEWMTRNEHALTTARWIAAVTAERAENDRLARLAESREWAMQSAGYVPDPQTGRWINAYTDKVLRRIPTWNVSADEDLFV